VLGNFDISADFLEKYGDLIDQITNIVAPLLAANSPWGRIIATIMPIIKPVLNWIFGKSEEQIIEEAKNKFVNESVERIITDIRPEVLKVITSYQNTIRERMAQEFKNKLEVMKAAMLEKKGDAQKDKQEVEQEIATLKDAIDKLETLK